MGFRSLLFAPASDSGKMVKALASPADGVILDLEDAVAPSEKDRARVNLVNLLVELQSEQSEQQSEQQSERQSEQQSGPRPGQQAKRILVRINSLKSEWALQDLLAIGALKFDGVVLPKTESGVDVQKVIWVWKQLNGQQSGIGVYPMIESAAGVEEVVSIAKCSPWVRQLLFGSLDYLVDLELRYPAQPSALAYARSRLVSASAAAGLEGPLDGVYPPIKDEEGLRRETEEAKLLGCKGKMVIHPAQIAAVNELFTPTEEQVEEARQMLEVYQKAQAEGKGAIQWQGKMLDEPALKWAKRVLGL